MDKLAVFVFICSICLGSAKIEILDLNIPESIEYGSLNETILDCVFEVTGDTGVVIKWFYNGQIEQIYQWIPEYHRHGNAMGKLKDNIDINYKVTEDNNTMFRALKLKDISPEMSGNYTCKVTSNEDEVFATKQLIIYKPAEDGLNLVIHEEESLVICSVNGVYPKPNMTLYATGENETEITVFMVTDEYVDDDGLYNITQIINFEPQNLTNPTKFVCDLNIPGTDYFLTSKVEHSIEIDVYDIDDIHIKEEDYFTSNMIISATSNSTNDTLPIKSVNSGYAVTTTYLPIASSILFGLFLLIIK